LNEQELIYILADKKSDTSGIGRTSVKNTDGGQEHPLWAILRSKIPISRDWKSLNGAERGQIEKAATKLHALNIPYSFYAEFLVRTNKTYLIGKGPMLVTKYGLNTRGMTSVLGEYLMMMKHCLTVYKRNPDVIKVNDFAYRTFPDSLQLGTLKYIFGIDLIEEALRTRSPLHLMKVATTCAGEKQTIERFWNDIGRQVEDRKEFSINLNTGVRDDVLVKALQKEMRIRLGREVGTLSPDLDRYFKKNGTLTVWGAKLITGDK